MSMGGSFKGSTQGSMGSRTSLGVQASKILFGLHDLTWVNRVKPPKDHYRRIMLIISASYVLFCYGCMQQSDDAYYVAIWKSFNMPNSTNIGSFLRTMQIVERFFYYISAMISAAFISEMGCRSTIIMGYALLAVGYFINCFVLHPYSVIISRGAIVSIAYGVLRLPVYLLMIHCFPSGACTMLMIIKSFEVLGGYLYSYLMTSLIKYNWRHAMILTIPLCITGMTVTVYFYPLGILAENEDLGEEEELDDVETEDEKTRRETTDTYALPLDFKLNLKRSKPFFYAIKFELLHLPAFRLFLISIPLSIYSDVSCIVYAKSLFEHEDIYNISKEDLNAFHTELLLIRPFVCIFIGITQDLVVQNALKVALVIECVYIFSKLLLLMKAPRFFVPVIYYVLFIKKDLYMILSTMHALQISGGLINLPSAYAFRSFVMGVTGTLIHTILRNIFLVVKLEEWMVAISIAADLITILLLKQMILAYNDQKRHEAEILKQLETEHEQYLKMREQMEKASISA